MREIKFRAWDKINKKLYKVLEFRFWNTVQLLVDEKNEQVEVHQDNLEIMQYTGFKDKNGKEIYEVIGNIYENPELLK